MDKQAVVALMIEALQDTLDEQGEDQIILADASSPLIGGDAVVTSLQLVSFISDVELILGDTYDLDITLVSEQALSRRHSPFRTIDTLSDYVLELVGEAVPAT